MHSRPCYSCLMIKSSPKTVSLTLTDTYLPIGDASVVIFQQPMIRDVSHKK